MPWNKPAPAKAASARQAAVGVYRRAVLFSLVAVECHFLDMIYYTYVLYVMVYVLRWVVGSFPGVLCNLCCIFDLLFFVWT